MTYLVNGQIVERSDEPRFRIVIRLNQGGRAEPGDVEWIDDPPMDVYALTGYLQQAVDEWNREQSLAE